MKSNYMNYFKDGKLYQWDKDRVIFSIQNTTIQGEFCLDKKGMDVLLKFNTPEITKGKNLKVKEGKTVVNIPMTEEVLVVPSLEFENKYYVSAGSLHTAVEFINPTDKRVAMQGIHLGNNHITATDNIVVYEAPCSTDGKIIIPKEFISILPKTSNNSLYLQSNKNSICYEAEDGSIYIGRLLEGNWLDTRGIVNLREGYKEINLTPIRECLRFYTDAADMIELKKDSVSLVGMFNTKVDAEFPIDFNCKVSARLLNKILSNISYDTCTCEYRGRQIVFNGNFLVSCVGL